MKDLETLLENPPLCGETVRDLYNWSTNYDYDSGRPFLEFLDLIGWTTEEMGAKLNNPLFEIDYESAYQMGLALISWSTNPQDVSSYIEALLEAEGQIADDN